MNLKRFCSLILLISIVFSSAGAMFSGAFKKSFRGRPKQTIRTKTKQKKSRKKIKASEIGYEHVAIGIAIGLMLGSMVGNAESPTDTEHEQAQNEFLQAIRGECADLDQLTRQYGPVITSEFVLNVLKDLSYEDESCRNRRIESLLSTSECFRILCQEKNQAALNIYFAYSVRSFSCLNRVSEILADHELLDLITPQTMGEALYVSIARKDNELINKFLNNVSFVHRAPIAVLCNALEHVPNEEAVNAIAERIVNEKLAALKITKITKNGLTGGVYVSANNVIAGRSINDGWITEYGWLTKKDEL